MKKSVMLHHRIRRLIVVCCAAYLLLATIALEALTSACNEEILNKAGANSRMLAYLVESCMNDVEILAMDLFQNSRVQENLAVVNSSINHTQSLQAQQELTDMVATLSLNKPRYVSLIGVMDNNGIIYRYGGERLNDAYLVEVRQSASATRKDGKAQWIAMENGGLLLCQAIRQTRMLSLSRIGTVLILVETDKMIQSLDPLKDNAAASTMLFLNDQLIFNNLQAADAEDVSGLLAQLDRTNRDYVISEIDGYDYFVTRHVGGNGVSYLMLDAYDALIRFLRMVEFWLLLGLVALLPALVGIGLKRVDNSFSRLNRLTGIVQETGVDRFLEHFDDSLLTPQDETGQLALRFRELLTRIDALVNQSLRKELTITTAQLQMLEAQMHPHFLYNTLDALHAMALQAGQSDMAEITLALSRLFRASLRKEMVVSVEEEFSFVREYLRIYKLRYGRQIQAVLEYPIEETARRTLPKMILQPLVENAVRHGLEQKPGVCRIHVRLRLHAENVILSVWDNGLGFPPEQAKRYLHPESFEDGDTHGLFNVIRRLYLLYREDLSISIRSREGHWTNISLSFPGKEDA